LQRADHHQSTHSFLRLRDRLFFLVFFLLPWLNFLYCIFHVCLFFKNISFNYQLLNVTSMIDDSSSSSTAESSSTFCSSSFSCYTHLSWMQRLSNKIMHFSLKNYR
jgi:hypothetical protein